MKYNSLVAIIENRSGGMYQIALSRTQQDHVFDLISQLHNGSVKIMKPKLSTALIDKVDSE